MKLFRLLLILCVAGFCVLSCSKPEDEPQPVTPNPPTKPDPKPDPEPEPEPEKHGWAVDTIEWKSTGGFVTNIERTSDGKFIVCNFKTLARLNSDGTHDPSFPTYTTDKGSFFKIQLEGDKILVMGSFRNFHNTDKDLLVRLNADGSIDQEFKAPFYFVDEYNSNNVMTFQDSIYAVVPRTDNSYIVVGKYRYLTQPGAGTSPSILNFGKIDKTTGAFDHEYGKTVGGQGVIYYPVITQYIAGTPIRDAYVYPDNSVLLNTKALIDPDGYPVKDYKFTTYRPINIYDFFPVTDGSLLASTQGYSGIIRINPATGIDEGWSDKIYTGNGTERITLSLQPPVGVVEFGDEYIVTVVSAPYVEPIRVIKKDGTLLRDRKDYIHPDFLELLESGVALKRSIIKTSSVVYDVVKESETSFILAGFFVNAEEAYVPPTGGGYSFRPISARGLIRFVKK